MLDFSKLKQRITLQAPFEMTLNSISEQTPIYQNVCEVWADVQPLKGREYQESQKLQAETQYRIIIRYREGLHQNWHILWNNKTLQITDILDDNLKEKLEIMAFEVKSE